MPDTVFPISSVVKEMKMDYIILKIPKRVFCSRLKMAPE